MTGHDRKVIAQQALADRIADLGGHPAPGDLYRHHRGDLYAVVMVGIDEDTLTPQVGYFSADRQSYWTRTLDEWLRPVEGPDGVIRPRFALHRPNR